MSQKSKYLIVLSGPTAIGKSQVALQLAKHFETEIIGADSRQVYAEMQIGTARPGTSEMLGIPHHLVGTISIHDTYAAGTFEKEAISILNDIFTENQFAILCGGTGLYIQAVVEGLDEFPEVSIEIQQKWASRLDQGGIEELQTAIKKIDPTYAETVDLENPRRLLRALCVSEAAGKPYSSFLGVKKSTRRFTPILINLELDREKLYRKINDRVDKMIDKGLITEARKLYPSRHLKALETVGYRELFQHFDGEISLDEAIRLIKRNSRRYAKRQMTWIRNSEDWQSFQTSEVKKMIDHIESIVSTQDENR